MRISLNMNKFREIFLVITAFLIYSNMSYACDKNDNELVPTIHFPPRFGSVDPRNDYTFQLIELILAKSTNKYGPCKVAIYNYRLPLKRIEMYLEKNENIDIASFTVNQQRDAKFLPIKIPISKGLMGYRLFLIRNGDETRFKDVNNLADLSRFTAGQGYNWLDAKILADNGLPVIIGSSINSLIDMLVFKRFDYFPRGALQIIAELKTYQNKSVSIEPSLVLNYPSISALYVSKSNTALAERLEYGFKEAFKDGSFDKFFYSHPSSVQALTSLDLPNRKIIKICNPTLPAWVPIEVDEYWLHSWPANFRFKDCKLPK